MPTSTNFVHSKDNDDIFDPEELFSNIFGGSPFAQARHSHFHSPNGFSSRAPTSRPPVKHLLLQIIPILLLFYFSGAFQRQAEPTYSLTFSPKHNIKMHTTQLKVPFYVAKGFEGLSVKEQQSASASAEREYFELFQSHCYQESAKKVSAQELPRCEGHLQWAQVPGVLAAKKPPEELASPLS